MKKRINIKALCRFLVVTLVVLSMGIFVQIKKSKAYEETFDKTYTETKETLSLSDSGCVVLNYHLIVDDNLFTKARETVFGKTYDPMYNIYLSEFEQEMAELKENNIDVVSLDEINEMVKNHETRDNCAAITFDDIDESVYENAYPILKEYNYPFTLFIVTGEIPESWGLKQEDFDNVKKMYDEGLATIGLHTDSFHDMDESNGQPRFLDVSTNTEFKEDTKLSWDKYTDFLGVEPKYFAYPHGFGNYETDQILINQGFEMLFTLREGVVDENTNPYFVPRILVTPQSFDAVMEWYTN